MKCVRLILVILLLLLASCGSKARLGNDSNPVVLLHQGSVTKEQMLSELNALPTPAGVSEQKFGQLKQALRVYLESRGATKMTAAAPNGPRNKVDDLTSAYTDDGSPGIQWNYRNVGDYDLNGEVNIADLSALGANLGKSKSLPGWDSAQFADGDGNGEVNISDLTPIGANLLSQVITWKVEGSDFPDGPWSYVQVVQREGDGSVRLPTKMITYVFVPAVQKKYYRVTPIDAHGGPGITSKTSVQFIISPETKIIGDPGMPTYASRNVDNITLNNPAGGGPFPISVGDIIVGEEGNGYMLRVVSLTPQGNQTLVEGTPAPMVDVFVQGGVGAKFNADGTVGPAMYTGKGASATIPNYDFDIGGQVIHDEPTLKISIDSGIFNFLPNADVAINYNKYRGVTYLKALLDTDSMHVKMTPHVIASGYSGTFPATPADTMFFEKEYTSLTFNLSTRQNGVPVVVTAEYDIYLGAAGSGTFNGETLASMDATYTDLLLGGIYTPGVGVQDFNQSTAAFDNQGIPTLPRTGGDFDLRVYVRPDVHMKLYGNPIPGSSEDLDLNAIPFLHLNGQRTTTPGAGYNFLQEGGMDSRYKMSLFHLGSADVQQADLSGVPDTVRAGFEPDASVPHYRVFGNVGTSLPTKVVVTDTASGQVLGVDYADAEETYEIAGIPEGTAVTVTPYSAAELQPASADVTMTADQEVDFIVPPG